MNNNHTIEISKSIQKNYNEQYSEKKSKQWRELCAKYKALNIINLSKKYKFKKVLECGAGEGSILQYLDINSKFEELYAIEISDSGISQIKKRNIKSLKEVEKFNGYKIPYPDNYFDMVYCSHVIEHVEHPRIILRELKRISRYQIFEIPLDYNISISKNYKNYLSYGHINIYTPSLFKFLLKSEGYKIISELFKNTTRNVIKFNNYNNRGIKNNFYNNLKLNISFLIKIIKKIIIPKKYYKEYCYSAYACLAEGDKNIEIFYKKFIAK